MVGLGLIVLIASSAINDALQLSDGSKVVVNVGPRTKSTAHRGSSQAHCGGDEIHIGGQDGIVIREAKCADNTATPPNSAASAASAAQAGASTPAADSSDANDGLDTETSDQGGTVIERTLGGLVHDVFSALFIALFAYLAAAKIIVRKAAESDAKVRIANDSTEREAMQRQLVQARLKLLQAQVEPHFLFNTLAAVDYLIETDPRRASIMQKLLINYLRAALPQMRQESSTLGRELTLIRPYLELLKLRIEDRLSYDIQVPVGLESAVFPPMMLQSIVENAIKHGIEPSPAGGKITVLGEVVDGDLRLDIADTGVGLSKGKFFTPPDHSTGLGLDNIRHRLALLYPGRSSLELRPGAQGGTLVRVTIPYQTQATPHHEDSH